MTPFESILREVLRPRSVLNYHPRGATQWDWSPVDGWRANMRLPRRDPIFTPLFASILGAANVTLFGSVTVASALSALATTSVIAGIQVHL